MKQVIIFSILFAVSMATQAQVEPGSNAPAPKRDITRTWFSMHAGMNYSGIEGETDIYTDLMPGYTAGFRFSFLKITERLRINVELNYSEQGGKYTLDNGNLPPGLPKTGKLRLYYANCPVTLRFQGDKGFYVELGGQAGYLFRAENKYNGKNTDVKDDMKKIDYDVLGGMGFRITKYIGVGVRAVPGLANINRNIQGVAVNSDRNMVFTALVSYYW